MLLQERCMRHTFLSDPFFLMHAFVLLSSAFSLGRVPGVQRLTSSMLERARGNSLCIFAWKPTSAFLQFFSALYGRLRSLYTGRRPEDAQDARLNAHLLAATLLDYDLWPRSPLSSLLGFQRFLEQCEVYDTQFTILPLGYSFVVRPPDWSQALVIAFSTGDPYMLPLTPYSEDAKELWTSFGVVPGSVQN